MSDWTRNPSVIDVADCFRVGCIVIAAVALGYALSAAMSLWTHRRTTPPPVWFPLVIGISFLLAGGAALTVSALFTEVGRLGTQLTWRLPVNMFGTASVALGSMFIQVLASGTPLGGPTAWLWRRVHRGRDRVDHAS